MKNKTLFIFLIFEIVFIVSAFSFCILYLHFDFVTTLNTIGAMSSIRGILYAIIFIISQNKQLDVHHENIGEMITQHLTS